MIDFDDWTATLSTPGLASLCLLAGLVLLVRGRRPARRRWARGLLVVWVSSLAWLALEAAFVFGVDTTDAFAASLLSRRWFHRHAGPPNRLGLRERELPPGPPGVVVLGDSFVWGNGVADRSRRVSARLETYLGGGRTVVNCAHPGFGTAEEAELYARLVAAHGAPGALVHVYVWNDAPAPPGEAGFAPPPAPLDRLLCRSYALDFFALRARALFDPAVRGYLARVARRYEDPALLARHEAELDALRAAAEGRGTRYLLVGWPFHGQGDAFAPAYAWLARYAAARRVQYLDLAPVFAGHPPAELTVGRFDQHPNETAHDLAARAIAAALQ